MDIYISNIRIKFDNQLLFLNHKIRKNLIKIQLDKASGSVVRVQC